MYFVNTIYKTDERLYILLDRGKSQQVLTSQDPNYLFYRPDFIATADGLKVCEIETPPFGLGLSYLLNKCYSENRYDITTNLQNLPEYVQSNFPEAGKIIYTDKIKQYKSQLEYLAKNVFSQQWKSEYI